MYRASAVTEALIAADRASDRPLTPAAIRLRMDAHAAAGARLAPAVREIVALDDSTVAVHRWAPRTAADNEYLLVRITNTGLVPYARLRLSGQRRLLGRLGSRFLLLDSSTDEPVLMTIRMAAQPQRAQ